VREVERELLLERVTAAWRARDRDGVVRPHPAWHDLDASARHEAFQVTRLLRVMEAALDPDGLNSTARAVLARIGTGGAPWIPGGRLDGLLG
jgi:hypothetical protein